MKVGDSTMKDFLAFFLLSSLVYVLPSNGQTEGYPPLTYGEEDDNNDGGVDDFDPRKVPAGGQGFVYRNNFLYPTDSVAPAPAPTPAYNNDGGVDDFDPREVPADGQGFVFRNNFLYPTVSVAPAPAPAYTPPEELPDHYENAFHCKNRKVWNDKEIHNLGSTAEREAIVTKLVEINARIVSICAQIDNYDMTTENWIMHNKAAWIMQEKFDKELRAWKKLNSPLSRSNSFSAANKLNSPLSRSNSFSDAEKRHRSLSRSNSFSDADKLNSPLSRSNSFSDAVKSKGKGVPPPVPPKPDSMLMRQFWFRRRRSRIQSQPVTRRTENPSSPSLRRSSLPGARSLTNRQSGGFFDFSEQRKVHCRTRRDADGRCQSVQSNREVSDIAVGNDLSGNIYVSAVIRTTGKIEIAAKCPKTGRVFAKQTSSLQRIENPQTLPALHINGHFIGRKFKIEISMPDGETFSLDYIPQKTLSATLSASVDKERSTLVGEIMFSGNLFDRADIGLYKTGGKTDQLVKPVSFYPYQEPNPYRLKGRFPRLMPSLVYKITVDSYLAGRLQEKEINKGY